MSAKVIWCFIKFFEEERFADQFMAGGLYFNTLAYFKGVESENNDGRKDSTEALAAFWQPKNMTIKIHNIPSLDITDKDLAGPVRVAFDYHNHLHVFCLYAVYTTGFNIIEGEIDCAPEDIEELKRQLTIDECCLKLGKFAVIVAPAVPFLDQLKEALNSQGYKATGKLVEYYDDKVFHGKIPMTEIPFRKQKRFSYQREFRLCVDTRTQADSALTINIGDISHICVKVDTTQHPELIDLKIEPAPQV